jgi:RHS repeat-associated protein
MLGGTWRYHFYDGLGSTRQLMLHASPYTVTDTYSYEAFGNLLSSTGTTANPYRYVGSLGYYATGSSLMHLGARYYMPEVGRFVQPEPWQIAPHLGHLTRDGALSTYAYVRGRPVVLIDPSGHVEGWFIGGIAGGLVGFLVGRCVDRAWEKACDIANRGQDKLAHCFFVCKSARCAGGGPLPVAGAKFLAEVVPAEDNPEDSNANTTGARCALAWWRLSCEGCCRKELPRLGWR